MRLVGFLQIFHLISIKYFQKKNLVHFSFVIIVALGVYFTFFFDYTTQYEDDDDLSVSTPETAKWVNNEEIRIFRKYLRYPTVTHSGNFGKMIIRFSVNMRMKLRRANNCFFLAPCVKFLEKLATDLELAVSVFYPVDAENPLVLMTLKGSKPELPSILLHSHVDVVPVFEEFWTKPPFGASIDSKGNIYARGAQDMKPVGMQYLGAIRALKRKGIKQLKRTVHLTYSPDEETGSEKGFGQFLKTNDFKGLNVGFSLDEGYPSATNNLDVYYADKRYWTIVVTARGHSGHSSLPFNDTASDKLNYVINKFLEFRRDELKKMNELGYSIANITVINLTILNGGKKVNIVPPEMSATFNLRIPIDADLDALDEKVILIFG